MLSWHEPAIEASFHGTKVCLLCICFNTRSDSSPLITYSFAAAVTHLVSQVPDIIYSLIGSMPPRFLHVSHGSLIQWECSLSQREASGWACWASSQPLARRQFCLWYQWCTRVEVGHTIPLDWYPIATALCITAMSDVKLVLSVLQIAILLK